MAFPVPSACVALSNLNRHRLECSPLLRGLSMITEKNLQQHSAVRASC